MQDCRIRIHRAPHEADPDDDALGWAVVDRIRRALATGGAPTAAVVVRPNRFDIMPLGPLASSGASIPLFLAGLTRLGDGQDPPIAVGIAGVTRKRQGTPQVVQAFLEWPDCRWWQWKALLNLDGTIMDESETVARAIDGTARPRSLGGWWSLGRRKGVRLRLQPVQPELVH